jgi:XRE family transcriptional regulator, fatty acid utilization regulator
MTHNTTNSSIGTVIRTLRERMGWTQLRLAQALGFASSQIVSSIEKGERELKAAEVLKVAKIFHVSVETLIRGEMEPCGPVQWRDKSPNADKEIELKFLERARRYARLEEWCNWGPPRELESLHIAVGSSFANTKREAEKIRRILDLGGRPALSLAKTLEEDYGVKIFYDDLGDIGAGMSARGDFGSAVLLNSSNPAWRRNFSLGHELFHLVAIDQDSVNSADIAEKLANCFSSHLLLPTQSLDELIEPRVSNGKLAYRALIEVAREFCVSSEALLWRLSDQRRIDRTDVQRLLQDSTFRAMDRASFPRESRPPSPLPDRYKRLALSAYERGKLGVARLAEFLESNIVDVAEDVATVEVTADELDAAQVTVA